jgi:hypothetical protein
MLPSAGLVVGVGAQIVVVVVAHVINVVQGQHGLVHGRVDHPVGFGHPAGISVIVVVVVVGVELVHPTAGPSVAGGAGGKLLEEAVLVVEPRRHSAARHVREEPRARSRRPLSRHQHQKQQANPVRSEAGQDGRAPRDQDQDLQ